MKISFSIVIPLYNKEKSISNTIESVLNQTYCDFELIVVNDGSLDSSLEVVKGYGDDRIVIVDKPNGGVSSARNEGIKKSNNEYIAFLDGDDLWHKDYLSAMSRLILEHPKASFYGSNFARINGGKEFAVNNSLECRGYVINYFKSSLFEPIAWTSAVVVKRNCFDEVGMFDPSLTRGEDVDMWCRLARKYKMAFEPAVLSYYVQDAENRACINTFDFEKTYFPEIKNFDIKEEKEYYLMRLSGVLLRFIKTKDCYNLLRLTQKYKLYIFKMIYNILRNKLNSMGANR